MKYLIMFLFVFSSLSAATVFFSKEEDDRFNSLETTVATPSGDGLYLKRVARANHNFALDGGTASASYASGVSLPAKSIITNSYFRINDTIVSASDNTVALTCNSSGDVYAAADLTDSATAIVLGAISDSATPVYVYSAAGCNVSVDVGAGTTGITAGNLTWFIEYDITD